MMKKASFIFFGGLAAGLLVFLLVHSWRAVDPGMAHEMEFPELAWIKTGFSVSDAQFKTIGELHEAYLPHCMEMCRRIDQARTELNQLLANNREVTPAVEAKLAEAAGLRLQCQKLMLQHFYEVSRVMPEKDGQRYLAVVQAETLRHP